MNIFISHVQQDRDYASTLRKALKNAGLSVWEPESLQPGENWRLRSGEALEKADVVIVVLSPESSSSEWLRKEIEFAISSPRLKGHVIPVLRRPARDIPWILRELPQWMEEQHPVVAAKRIASALKVINADVEDRRKQNGILSELVVRSKKKTRTGRNPRTGEEIKIPPKLRIAKTPKNAAVTSKK
jgi:nucleoid DNA-binding protein